MMWVIYLAFFISSRSAKDTARGLESLFGVSATLDVTREVIQIKCNFYAKTACHA